MASRFTNPTGDTTGLWQMALNEQLGGSDPAIYQELTNQMILATTCDEVTEKPFLGDFLRKSRNTRFRYGAKYAQ